MFRCQASEKPLFGEVGSILTTSGQDSAPRRISEPGYHLIVWPTITALVIAGLGGCFSPRPPTGAPCDPASPAACPAGQVCTAQAAGHFCLEPGTGVETDASPDTASNPDPDGPADTILMTHFEYPADVAECVDPGAPNPTTCRSENKGSQNDLFQMVVDLDDAANGNPWVGYIRFVIDDAFAGQPITSVKLRVTVTDDELAPAPQTGEVFAVAPFVLADLTGTAPAKVGNRLAASLGAVDKLDVVDFPLPVASVSAGAPAHFGIFATTTSGVNYWNKSGPNPPVLVIDTE
jgi:hypothetical protein